MRSVSFAYHQIREAAPPGTAMRFTLNRVLFAHHLNALSKAATPRRATDISRPGQRRVFLTFDDGDESALDAVAPMLAERGWPGHFFVVTSWIGRPGSLSAAGLRELHAAGHVIGSHTRNHVRLDRASAAVVADEWRTSKAELEDILGARVTTASVPYGLAPTRALAEAADAGYEHIFTSRPTRRENSVASATIHGRFAVLSDTPPERIAALARQSRVALARERAFWSSRNAAKAALGPAYQRVRGRLVASRHE